MKKIQNLELHEIFTLDHLSYSHKKYKAMRVPGGLIYYMELYEESGENLSLSATATFVPYDKFTIKDK